MKGYSAIYPETLIRHEGGYQFRYNIVEAPREIDGQPVPEYQFDYVNAPAADRDTLIDALITSRYSYPSQLGKLALDRTSQEWLDYDAFRQGCYAIVDAALAQ